MEITDGVTGVTINLSSSERSSRNPGRNLDGVNQYAREKRFSIWVVGLLYVYSSMKNQSCVKGPFSSEDLRYMTIQTDPHEIEI